jgi:hypothetical protein
MLDTPVKKRRLMPHLASVLCCAACHTFWCNVDGSGSLAVKFAAFPDGSDAANPGL